MVATFLQDALAEELASIFEHFILDDPDGNKHGINIYKQALPVPVAEELPLTITDEELEEGIYDAKAKEAPFPYIIVRVEEGTIEEINSVQTVSVSLLVGVIDRNHDNQGHKDVLNILQKVYERFSKNAFLAKKYECVMPMQWALQEEQSFPYFFGGMALRFETTPIRREDPYI